MIRIYILKVEQLMDEDFGTLAEALPFGGSEASRLLAISNSKHKWESLGGLIALSRLVEKCESNGVPFSREILRAPSGKPFFNSPNAPHFGISHSHGIAAAALSDCKYGEIGFDIEVIDRDYDFLRVADRYFTDSEKSELEASGNTPESFFAIWTAKEALAKADGRGLSALISGSSDRLLNAMHLTRLNIDIGNTAAVMSIYSYVKGQPIQIYKEENK